jgi:hypothetical protein
LEPYQKRDDSSVFTSHGLPSAVYSGVEVVLLAYLTEFIIESGGVVLNLEHDRVLMWCDVPNPDPLWGYQGVEQLLTSLNERFPETSSKILTLPIF